MWKMVAVGDGIEVDVGQGFQAHSVSLVEPGRICVHPIAANASGAAVPSYRFPPIGQTVRIRIGDQVRTAAISEEHDSLMTLTPAYMRHGGDGADCPFCWQERVPGSPTGFAVGTGFGPHHNAQAVPTTQHDCPGCKESFNSLEWYSLAREQL